MTKWKCECSSWDCDFCEVESVLKPKKCPTTGNDMISAVTIKDEDTDYIEKKTQSPRPIWEKGRRKQIRERYTSPGGTLYCAICNEEIKVDAMGKERWRSKSNKVHTTSPHIDHYKKDWIVRKRKLHNSKEYQNANSMAKKKMKKEKFNESPLRTVHRLCNLCRAKESY